MPLERVQNPAYKLSHILIICALRLTQGVFVYFYLHFGRVKKGRKGVKNARKFDTGRGMPRGVRSEEYIRLRRSGSDIRFRE